MAEASTDNRIVSPPNLFAFLRIITGVILLYKSSLFIRDYVIAKTAIQLTGIGIFSQNVDTLAIVITYLGFLCGLFIAIGLFTRAAAIVQIPVLIVAVFFVNIKNVGDNVFEFILSMIMLLLLILFAIKGSGTFSADEYFRLGAEMDKNDKQTIRE